MLPRVAKVIKEGGDAITCEAQPNEGEGHAGIIIFDSKIGKKEILARTDPTFKTAEAALKYMEGVIRKVRGSGSKPAKKKKGSGGRKKSAKTKGE